MKVKIHPDFRNDFDVKVNPDDYRITAFDIETGKVLKKAKKAIFINCESKIVYKEDYLPNEMKYKRVWCECENDLIIHNDEDYDYGQLTKTIIVNKKAIDKIGRAHV